MCSVLKNILVIQFALVLVAVFVAVYRPELVDHIKEVILQKQDEEPIALKFGASEDSGGVHLFTKEALAQFDGKTDETPIYLSILGEVFDVSRGRKHYGIGCSYGFFAARDASKAFATGEFDEFTEDSDDVLSLDAKDLLSLITWKDFYHKDYTFKGKLIGRFYDHTGAKTKYYHKFDALVQQAREQKVQEDKLKERFPPCNIQWAEETGTKVWCTKDSDGKTRDWVGVPRKYFEPGKDTFRCACVREDDLSESLLKPYDDCDLKSDTCFYTVD